MEDQVYKSESLGKEILISAMAEWHLKNAIKKWSTLQMENPTPEGAKILNMLEGELNRRSNPQATEPSVVPATVQQAVDLVDQAVIALVDSINQANLGEPGIKKLLAALSQAATTTAQEAEAAVEPAAPVLLSSLKLSASQTSDTMFKHSLLAEGFTTLNDIAGASIVDIAAVRFCTGEHLRVLYTTMRANGLSFQPLVPADGNPVGIFARDAEISMFLHPTARSVREMLQDFASHVNSIARESGRGNTATSLFNTLCNGVKTRISMAVNSAVSTILVSAHTDEEQTQAISRLNKSNGFKRLVRAKLDQTKLRVRNSTASMPPVVVQA